MALCSSCGSPLQEGGKFCKTCGAGASQAESRLGQKKARVLSGEKKKSTTVVIAAATLVFVLLGGVVLYRTFGGKTVAEAVSSTADRSANPGAVIRVKAEQGLVRIPLKGADNGKAKFFVYAAAGRDVTFFVVQAPDGSYRAALNACTACYRAKRGYRQEGGAMICNNCGMGFRLSDIGVVHGGCNPIPFTQTIDGQMLVLQARDLDAGANYF